MDLVQLGYLLHGPPLDSEIKFQGKKGVKVLFYPNLVDIMSVNNRPKSKSKQKEIGGGNKVLKQFVKMIREKYIEK